MNPHGAAPSRGPRGRGRSPAGVARPRTRVTLLILLWIWAACVFTVVDLFWNVEEFDGVRPRSGLYPAMRWAAHELVGEALPEDARCAWVPGRLVLEERYPDGSVRIRREAIRLADGRLLDYGTWTLWGEDGNPLVQCETRNGVPHGTLTIWHPGGPKAHEGEVRDGREEGVWRQWDECGNEIVEEEYVAGRRMELGPGEEPPASAAGTGKGERNHE